MGETSRSSTQVVAVVSAALAASYGTWAASFIARSSVETASGRAFCLFDDAMVSLRYAWNFAHGEGLVWNPGERVEGITSFLSTLTMIPGVLFFDKSGAALVVQIMGIAFVLAAAFLAGRLGRSLGMSPPLELVTSVAVLAYYPLSYWSLMGMETGLLAVLSSAALVVAMRLGAEPRGGAILGLLCGLLFMTRPDAAVPAAAILGFRAAWILSAHRRLVALKPWLLEAAIFAGIALVLTLFRLAYYGSPVPNTYDLKMGDWPIVPRVRNGWKFVVPFLETTLYLLVLAFASVLLRRDARRLLLFCFAASVVACQIWVGGDAWPYWRMLVPGVVAMLVLAVDGGCAVIHRLSKTERPWLAVCVSALCTAGSLVVANRPFLDEISMKTPAHMVRVNRRTVPVGIELSRYADPKASVAVMAAGAVPYYSGLRGVDVLGKSDRHIARLIPHEAILGETVVPGHNKYDLEYSIGKLRPDVIYDALGWARYQPSVLDIVEKNYVPRGSFRFRRDSAHVHWDRLPP